MKKLCLVIACSGLLLYACVSNKQLDVTPAGQASISATVDGVTENFTASDSIVVYGPSVLLIEGTNPANNDHITLDLDKLQDTIDAGTYISDNLGGVNIRACEIMVVDNRDSTKYQNTGPYYTLPAGPTNARYPGSVIITAINDTLITGTFTATLVQEKSIVQQKTPVTRPLTNGVFSIDLRKVKISHAALRQALRH